MIIIVPPVHLDPLQFSGGLLLCLQGSFRAIFRSFR